MKKLIVIFAIVLIMLTINMVYGQDCGKCPLKSKCTPTKEKSTVTVQEVKVDPVVYNKKGDPVYHKKECKLVKEDFQEVKLSEALKNGLKPCTECKPADKLEPAVEKDKVQTEDDKK